MNEGKKERKERREKREISGRKKAERERERERIANGSCCHLSALHVALVTGIAPTKTKAKKSE